LIHRKFDGGPKIVAQFDGRRLQFPSDPRFVLRGAIEQNQIYLFELQRDNGQRGVALVRTNLDPQRLSKEGPFRSLLESGLVEIIDFADWAELGRFPKDRNMNLRELFPNSMGWAMWGKPLRHTHKGVGVKFEEHEVTIGGPEISPFHDQGGNGVGRVLFVQNMAMRVLAVSELETGNGLGLRDLGRLEIYNEVVRNLGERHPLSISRAGLAQIDLERMCEDAAVFKSVELPIEFCHGKLRMGFVRPPSSELLGQGSLDCKVWWGGVVTRWTRKVGGQTREVEFRLPCASDGTVLDGIGHEVVLDGKKFNVVEQVHGELTKFNFWERWRGLPQGIESKTEGNSALVFRGLISLALKEKLEPMLFEQCYEFTLNRGGIRKIKLPVNRKTEEILFTHPKLQSRFENGGKIKLTFERVNEFELGEIKESIVLRAYDAASGEYICELSLDPQTKRFWFSNGPDVRTYVFAKEPYQSYKVAGVTVYPYERDFVGRHREDNLIYADVSYANGIKTPQLIRIATCDYFSKRYLRPILTDSGQVKAYFSGKINPNKIPANFSGWVPFESWTRKADDGLSFTWAEVLPDGNQRSAQQNVPATIGRAIDIKDGEQLWARVEGKHVFALGLRRKGEWVNVYDSKIVRNAAGEIEQVAYHRLSRQELSGRIVTSLQTREFHGYEVVHPGQKAINVRKLAPGENFVSRDIAIVIGASGSDVVLVCEGKKFNGFLYKIAKAIAEVQNYVNRQHVEEALQQAARSFIDGEKPAEIIRRLLLLRHPLINEMFYPAKIRAEWKCLQNKEAENIVLELDFIRSRFKQLTNELGTSYRSASSSDLNYIEEARQTMRELADVVRALRELWEINSAEAESFEVALAAREVYLYLRTVVGEVLSGKLLNAIAYFNGRGVAVDPELARIYRYYIDHARIPEESNAVQAAAARIEIIRSMLL